MMQQMSDSKVQHCPFCFGKLELLNQHTDTVVCTICYNTCQKNGFTLIKKSLIQKVKDDFPKLKQGMAGKNLNNVLSVSGRIQLNTNQDISNLWMICSQEGKLNGLFECGPHLAWLELTKEPDSTQLIRCEVGKASPDANKNSFVRFSDHLVRECIHSGETLDIFKQVTPISCSLYLSEDHQVIIVFGMGAMAPFCLRGKLVSLNELGFPANPDLKNLSADAFVPTETVACPSCSNQVPLRFRALSRYACCNKCHRLFDVRAQKTLSDPIPLKTVNSLAPLDKGTIKGIDYVVMGIERFKEKDSIFTWVVYTIFNPQHGIAWLSCFKGNWIYLRQAVLNRPFDPDQDTLKSNGKKFAKFMQYRSELMGCQGEFFYSPKDTADRLTLEYIDPPDQWIQALSYNDLDVFQGEHIDHHEVKTAFSVRTMPSPSEAGVLAPNKYKNSYKANRRAFIIFATLVLLANIMFNSYSPDKQVVNMHKTLEQNSENSFRSDDFTLTQHRQNLEFTFEAPLVNAWIDFEVYLIESKTGKEYHFVQSLEYYTGYDDGTWEEGSRQGEAFISGVPEGNYYLLVFPSASQGVYPEFSVTLKQGVPMYGNAFWMLFFGLVFVSVQGYIYRKREAERWSQPLSLLSVIRNLINE